MQLSGTALARGKGKGCALARLDDLQREHDETGERDRVWFAGQRRSFRLRPITTAKQAMMQAWGSTHVLVERLADGFRFRWPLTITGQLDGTDEVLKRFTGEGRA